MVLHMQQTYTWVFPGTFCSYVHLSHATFLYLQSIVHIRNWRSLFLRSLNRSLVIGIDGYLNRPALTRNPINTSLRWSTLILGLLVLRLLILGLLILKLFGLVRAWWGHLWRFLGLVGRLVIFQFQIVVLLFRWLFGRGVAGDVVHLNHSAVIIFLILVFIE